MTRADHWHRIGLCGCGLAGVLLLVITRGCVRWCSFAAEVPSLPDAAAADGARARHDDAALDKVVRNVVDGRKVRGVAVRMVSGDGRTDYSRSAGDLAPDTLVFIASTTKLFVTALIMQLRHEGRLALDDQLSVHLPEAEVRGLHVMRGVDRSEALTIRHLLAQTSGLEDYFEGKQPNGKRLDRELLAGHDQGWTYDDAMRVARSMPPHFVPGAAKKAHYTDTNFQLLARVIERTTGQSFDTTVEARIIVPLGLAYTYVYRDTADRRPATMTGKQGPLHIPQAMASFGPDGGMVSTARELMQFLRAFFGGHLFPQSYVTELRVWNSIFFPLEYGVGIMRFRLSRWLSPFHASPELIGHSGLNGAFAFYCPERDIYLAGTLNSVVNPGAPFRLMLRLLSALPDERAG